MRQGAQDCCTGMTLRNGMGREVGGVSGWRTHVHPWLIHVNVWQKPLQYYKVISLQLIKVIGKKIIDSHNLMLFGNSEFLISPIVNVWMTFNSAEMHSSGFM